MDGFITLIFGCFRCTIAAISDQLRRMSPCLKHRCPRTLPAMISCGPRSAIRYRWWRIIMLFMEDKKNRPFIKFHAVQALALWVVYVVVGAIITTITFGIGGLCFGLAWLVFLYWAYLAYQGQMFQVPVVTDFLRSRAGSDLPVAGTARRRGSGFAGEASRSGKRQNQGNLSS